ncbi:hypothetical protein [Streptomyces anthocyanicus]|uniref:hypothetical protein n=1 Tax=Streptomyces anthocyanicus TaxID=68174 RepID=UPI0038649F8D|nr:hypothetical protein OH747_05750 [Streptomyces anthocyanicus]
MNAEQFNARYPVGTLVFAYPGVRPEDGTGTRLVTRTRTDAQLSASGDPVVWVEGEGAYICLTHVDPVAEDVWEAARKAEKQAELEAPSTPARLSPEREAEIRGYIATCTNWSLDAIAARDLLAELVKVRVERDEAGARVRKQIADDLHRADLPRFAEAESPELVAKTVRAVDVRIASWGDTAPYWVPKDGS